MKIYVLTKGDYSDYAIIGVFTQLELAKKAAYHFDAEIEEYNSDEVGQDDNYPFVFCYHVNNQPPEYCFAETTPTDEINNIILYGNPVGSSLRVTVMAENLEHATKIGSDLIAQYRALNE